jgi:hypothetical protein
MSDTSAESNHKIAMDIIGPMTKTKQGNQFILSIPYELTKYLILVALKTQQTESVINTLLKHYIYIFSAPKNDSNRPRTRLCKRTHDEIRGSL